jgi:hypothetical protein
MRRLGEKARAWIDASLEELGTAHEGEGALGPIKRAGELAMTAALTLDRLDDPGARAWLELCWGRLDDGRALVHAIEGEPGVVAMYPAFHRHGLRSALVEEAIAAAVPRIDHPILQLLVACSLAPTGLEMPWQLDRLLRESFLDEEPATWLVNDRQAYVITHVALFLSPAELLPERYRRWILRSAPAWIALFARAADLDLVGELVMVTHVLGACAHTNEWKLLEDAQEDDGIVPFRLSWRGRAVPPRTRLIANYHSTLVAFGAAAMCAARCRS